MNYLCKCGRDISHPKILHETEYSKWGWFLLTILGLSAKPKLVKFKCPDCGDEILATDDPDVLSKFVGR